MIVCDTHALLFDALQPERLGAAARQALDAGETARELACADISLWEIAMLLHKRRLSIEAEPVRFISRLLAARRVRVLPITPEIAALAQSPEFRHGDPADRLIAATALHHGAALITADQHLADVAGLNVIW